MTVKITKAQLNAIILMKADLNATIGCSERDNQWKFLIKKVDTFLKKNGFNEHGKKIK